jgi:drug/metabolite transporter (DMT)-like permease
MTLLAIFIWGTQLPIAKAVYGSVDGTTLSLLRYLVAIVGFAGVLLWREGVTAFSFDGHGRVVTIAGAGMAASAILVFGGLTFTRPESAAIILALQPAVTALMQWGLYRRRPAGYTLLCMLVAFVGVLLVVTRGGETLGLGIWGSAGIRAATASVPPGADREWLGNLMVVVGMVGWVTYTVITSSLSHWSSARVSTLTTIPTLGFLFAAWLIAVRLVYVSLFGALIAMLLWNSGARRIGALNAVLLANLTPVVTFATRAVEGVVLSAAELAGAALVVGALGVNSVLQRRERLRTGLAST